MKSSSPTTPTIRHVVVLVHGIRTRATWVENIRQVFEKEGLEVAPTSYGRFGLIRFLAPGTMFRKLPIERVRLSIYTARQLYDPCIISILAHSFGTYVVAHVLANNPDIKFEKIIFCGSVLRDDFPFEQYGGRFNPPLLNEVGTQDALPALAESAGWGYGSIGTNGFNSPLSRTRWHNGLRHSDFLTPEFAERFWVPFLKESRIVGGDRPCGVKWYIDLISLLRLRIVIALAAGVIIAYGGYKLIDISINRCDGLPGETAWIYGGQFDGSTGKFVGKPAVSVEGASKPLQEVSSGDLINLIVERRTEINNYGTNLANPYESPFENRSKNLKYTCRMLKPGQKLYVADRKMNGPSPSEQHLWIRVRTSPIGGGPSIQLH